MKNNPPLKILICSAFFDSRLVSYREYSYASNLSKFGHEVTLLCGDQGEVWRWKRNGLPVVDPTLNDSVFCEKYKVNLIRRKIIFRYSDFLLYLPAIGEIARADIVHVIEFRTGITVLVAWIAYLLGKPVVYDHEQRGGRSGHWYSKIDSKFRSLLIRIGAKTVSLVRHTVFKNLEYFLECAPRYKGDTALAPIGCSSEVFHYLPNARKRLRQDWGIDNGDVVAVMSGKLHKLKRVNDVLAAARASNLWMILVGDIPNDVRIEIEKISYEKLIIVPRKSSKELAEVYSACDIAIFTTFTLSQWEAYATGVSLIVPGTEFSKYIFSAENSVKFFGSESDFLVPDEVYREDAKIIDSLIVAARSQLEFLKSNIQNRADQDRFYSEKLAQKLESQYFKVLKIETPNY